MMGENSKIEWTHHTFNPWIGCAKVAPGCTNCYAEAFAKRTGKAKWGVDGTRVKTSEKYWRQPVNWDRDAREAGERRRVFCASMADIFEDWDGPILAPGRDPVILANNGRASNGDNRMTLGRLRSQLFALIDATPNLDWLLLTKRPQNIRSMWQRNQNPPSCPIEFQTGDVFASALNHYRFNVWIGCSISEQTSAEENIPWLLSCRDLAPILFVSAEPLLGPIDLKPRPLDQRGGCLKEHPHDGPCQTSGLNWVIVGGESGHHSRPMHPDWARKLRDQSQAAGVAYFFKQWGEWAPFSSKEIPESWPLSTPVALLKADGRTIRPYAFVDGPGQEMARIGKKAAGRLLDGREWNGSPNLRSLVSSP